MRHAQHTNNFDLIRLLAALQVLYGHSAGWLKLPPLPAPTSYAVALFPGVAVFFVISGFLVTRSFLESRSGTAGYFARRALRIYPGLWVHFVVILTMLAVAGALPLPQLAGATFWRWVAVAFTTGSDFYANLLAGLPFDYSGYYRWFPSGVLWTISVELGFYLLVPLVFAGVLRRRGLVWLALIVCAMVSLWAAWINKAWLIEAPSDNTTGILQCSPAPYFWIFLIGAAMSYYWETVRGWIEGRAWAWFIAYFVLSQVDTALFGAMGLNFSKPELLTVARVVLLGVTVIAFAHTWTGLARRLRGVDLSYGIYLYHMPLVATLHYGGVVGSAWLWPVVFVVPATCAALSWFLVERPALRFKSTADVLITGLQSRVGQLSKRMLETASISRGDANRAAAWAVAYVGLFLAIWLLCWDHVKARPQPKLEITRLGPDAWERIIAPMRRDADGLRSEGEASPTGYGAISVPHWLPKGALVAAAGTVQHGGIVLGLLDQNGQWAATTAISAGPFRTAVEVPARGSYRIVIANNLAAGETTNETTVTEVGLIGPVTGPPWFALEPIAIRGVVP
jgi:peptidoglycan/LPS O-acetylase OafA/YrhL